MGSYPEEKIENKDSQGRALQQAVGAKYYGLPNTQILVQYIINLWERLQVFALQPGREDQFILKWISSGQYSVASAYRAFFHGLVYFPCVKQLWKARAPLKCKFFVWLVLHKHCWAADRLQCHGRPNKGICSLCQQEPESVEHLFMECPMAREVWFRLVHTVGLETLCPSQFQTGGLVELVSQTSHKRNARRLWLPINPDDMATLEGAEWTRLQLSLFFSSGDCSDNSDRGRSMDAGRHPSLVTIPFSLSCNPVFLVVGRKSIM